jgi:3-dehydroquinate synthetase
VIDREMANNQSTFVTVTYGEETIKVGSNIFDLIPNDLQNLLKSSKYAVILDENVNKLYGNRFEDSFAKVQI